MSKLRITAVIPAFEAANFVAEAVASLRSQTLPPHEIIVVDDGSSDETATVAERAGARVIRQPNGGPGSARNTGIRAATTEWVALLDADDLSRPSRLERQGERLGDAGVAVVFAGSHVEGRLPTVPPAEITFDVLWAKNWIPASTVLLRRSAWESVGGFDETRELIGVEDYNLWLRLTHAGWRFSRVDEILVDYRPAPESLTSQTRRFAAAQLANARWIAEALALSPIALRSKEHAIFLDYGLELFHARDLAAARAFLDQAAQRGPISLGGQLRRLATYLPLRPRRP